MSVVENGTPPVIPDNVFPFVLEDDYYSHRVTLKP